MVGHEEGRGGGGIGRDRGRDKGIGMGRGKPIGANGSSSTQAVWHGSSSPLVADMAQNVETIPAWFDDMKAKEIVTEASAAAAEAVREGIRQARANISLGRPQKRNVANAMEGQRSIPVGAQANPSRVGTMGRDDPVGVAATEGTATMARGHHVTHAVSQATGNMSSASFHGALGRLGDVQPSVFTGVKVSTREAKCWLAELEGHFSALGIYELWKARLAAAFLRQDARTWWYDLHRMKYDSKWDEITWQIFQSEFLEEYVPENENRSDEEESVTEEQGKVVVEAAMRFDSHLTARPTKRKNCEVAGSSGMGGNDHRLHEKEIARGGSNGRIPRRERELTADVCQVCGKEHGPNTCEFTNPEGLMCYNCRHYGHAARACTRPRNYKKGGAARAQFQLQATGRGTTNQAMGRQVSPQLQQATGQWLG